MSKEPKGTTKSNKYLILVLMIISLCTIYILPYMRQSYFTPLQTAMNLIGRDADYGNLLTIYGLGNIIFYLPGGFIADKFDPKKLLVFSMVSSGVLGLWMATWPGYTMLLLIHLLWAITTVLTFWSSSIKVVNMLAARDEQGQTFGLMESGRGLVGFVLTVAFLGLFAAFAAKEGGDVQGVTIIVIIVSALMILDGVALALLLPKTDTTVSNNVNVPETLKALGKSFAKPITWALAGIIFACSAIGTSAYYFQPYLQLHGLSETMSVTFANLRISVLTVIGAVFAGYLSKKLKRSSRVMIYACILMIVMAAFLRFVPGSAGVVGILMVVMILLTFFWACNRGVYWAIIEEAGTSKKMVGSVVGVASLFGYLPDAFLNSVFGDYLENNETGVAFNKIFMTGLCFAFLGLAASLLADYVIKKNQAAAAAGAAETPEETVAQAIAGAAEEAVKDVTETAEFVVDAVAEVPSEVAEAAAEAVASTKEELEGLLKAGIITSEEFAEREKLLL